MFEDIINAAKETSNNPRPEVKENSTINISVIGVGGAGCNCVNRIYESGIKSANTMAINTDGKHLNMVRAHKKILIGKTVTRGLGAGGDVNIARKCADVDSSYLREQIGENELVFLCAGMGGGTGGGAAAPIAKIAKEQGAIVVAMVTYPFALERVRLRKAQASLQELVEVCDTVVVIDNNRLAAYFPNLPINKAFELADSITTRAVTGISDTIMFPSLINVDYADVQTVMKGGGLSMISLGQGNGHNRVKDVVTDTLEHPLLDVDYEGARGCLIHMEGGPDLTLGDAINAGEALTASFDESASVKMGARINADLQDSIRITAIITGVKSPYILGKKVDSGSNEAELGYL
ncbi:cell division protein FtsZ [Candidatus Micrarchaeota archaeon]|nr:cell division protein FtsZ [Candidatus Micrarchaeota archaeon]MBU1166006.1 cell division protein FtsZ [Candidatus Micrarchaeota archaeon]MBU1886926.1 cell division protein FtsZ [Candidatus Micrarchaeota archaeon]